MTEQQYENLCAALLGAGNTEEGTRLMGLWQQASSAERAALADLFHVLRTVPYAADPLAPPAELKQRILSLAGQPEAAQPAVQLWKNWGTESVPADMVIRRRQEGDWEATGVDGVQAKRLFADGERGYVSMLVRMAAGSAYPSHRHAGYEECYVLQGDLRVGETVLSAGDYQRAAGGSVHVVQSTEQGCLLFIVSSQHDELLV